MGRTKELKTTVDDGQNAAGKRRGEMKEKKLHSRKKNRRIKQFRREKGLLKQLGEAKGRQRGGKGEGGLKLGETIC